MATDAIRTAPEPGSNLRDRPWWRGFGGKTAIAALFVVGALGAAFVLRPDGTRQGDAGRRATDTISQLTPPADGSRQTAAFLYHWKDCEQGDCYTAQRTFSAGGVLTLQQADLALNTWAQRNHLTEVGSDDCVPGGLLQPPGDSGCARSWSSPGQRHQIITVWVHLAPRAGVSMTSGPNPWSQYLRQPVVDFLVEVVDSDPLPT